MCIPCSLVLGVIRTFILGDNRSFVSGCLCVCMFSVSCSFLFTCLSVCRFAVPFYATCMRQKQLKSPYKYIRTQLNQTVLSLETFATYFVFCWRHSPCSAHTFWKEFSMGSIIGLEPNIKHASAYLDCENS